MNLANEKTWKTVRMWSINIVWIMIYFIGFGLTKALFSTHLSVEELKGGSDTIAAMFWPIILPFGLMTWYPIQTSVVLVILVSVAAFVLLRIRQYQLEERN